MSDGCAGLSVAGTSMSSALPAAGLPKTDKPMPALREVVFLGCQDTFLHRKPSASKIRLDYKARLRAVLSVLHQDQSFRHPAQEEPEKDGWEKVGEEKHWRC